MSDEATIFTIANEATQMGFRMIDSPWQPNIMLQQRSSTMNLVLVYNKSERGVVHEKVTFHVSGSSLSYKNKSGASGELDGGLQFLTICEGTAKEHEAVRAGRTLFRKRNANGHYVPEQQENEVIFECPYDFAIFLSHLKKCEYQGGKVHRCYPFGYTKVAHFRQSSAYGVR